jgi:hypothetical protein
LARHAQLGHERVGHAIQNGIAAYDGEVCRFRTARNPGVAAGVDADTIGRVVAGAAQECGIICGGVDHQ